MAPDSLSLYIHWPFCLSKCPYCDFNSHVRDEVDDVAWEKALLHELDYWGQQTEGRRLISVFFGGGTPSLMPPRLVEALLSRARRWWREEENASPKGLPSLDTPSLQNTPSLEITLEANPTSVEAQKLRDFRQAGVNRLSLGLQALKAEDLQVLGRQHTVEEALDALALAARLFPRFSFDLIYARPGQTEESWARELTQALAFHPLHLSVYQLTVEPGTRFAALYERGALILPEEDVGARLYTLTQDILEGAGLPAYEVSNHARAGHECQHNLNYWRYGDYVGIGPGAHGRISLGQGAARQKMATATHRLPERWLEQVHHHNHGLSSSMPVPPHEQVQEMLLMGLRLKEGVATDRLAALGFTPSAAKMATLQKHGLLQLREGRLAATPAGRLCLNALTAELV